uniref:DUF4288 domain-containing protein n=1 Tax=Steinernema glaseri TaxID=37863 RepID=A0A1I7Z3T2_9BILA
MHAQYLYLMSTDQLTTGGTEDVLRWREGTPLQLLLRGVIAEVDVDGADAGNKSLDIFERSNAGDRFDNF